MTNKPLGIKAYGSIGHLPSSRLGPKDRHVHEGQARICTTKRRDKHDTVIVQDKLDGSCTAVAKIDGKIVALTRSGYLAASSPFEQHHLFNDWVQSNSNKYMAVLQEGERIVGEWLAQAHGTRYDLGDREPWVAFDIMRDHDRLCWSDLVGRVCGYFDVPTSISVGPVQPEKAAGLIPVFSKKYEPIPPDSREGVVYRVERGGKVQFLAKWVRSDKVDGKYFPENNGGEVVWNWRPR